MKHAVVLLALAMLGVALLRAVADMPPMGAPDNPDKVNVIPRYLAQGDEETGAANLVTGVILNYRGYDTLAEVAIIFASLCAVLALLGRERKGICRSRLDDSSVKPSMVVRAVVQIMVPVILLFAGYTILQGKLSPGGGFQGGAVIGASIIIFTLAFGLPESTRRIGQGVRVPLESSGILIFMGVGLAAFAFGANFLTLALPGLPPPAAESVRAFAINLLELAIGVAGGVIFTSIVFAMLREDQHVGPRG